MNPLSALQGITNPVELPRATTIAAPAKNFEQTLRDLAAPVTESKREVELELQRVLTGEATDLHTVQIAMQKAEVTFQMALQVRNKLLQAYHEIMQMQV